ncbi:MAG: hypothetical protein K2Q18_11330 [Bdellovibrionales bacterium]|nr:hypothetical protein [Bdellovibrionales bacterium]
MIRIFVLIFMLIQQVWAEDAKLEAVVLQDLMANSSERINIKQSNSSACKKPCNLKNYIATHFAGMAREIEKIKKTPKTNYEKVFGTSVNEKDKFQTSFVGSCLKDEKVSFPEEDFE